MRRRVLFYVQHLLGIGHLVRAYRVADGLQDAGFDVTLALGGVPAPGVALPAVAMVQLPPVKAGPDGFSQLVHPDGSAFTEADQTARCQALLSLFHRLQPDVVITEAFPFGRRPMRFELLPLLDAARSRASPPLIACSIRDILQESRKPGRDEEIASLVERAYDLVLVHGDPEFAPLEASFPLARRFADKIAYTGLVGPSGGAALADPYPVVVSAGGGAVGAALLSAALAARRLTSLRDERWLVVTGPHLNEAASAGLAAKAGEGVTVVRVDPRLPEQLAQARLSISQAGYNTVADLMLGSARPVLIPFASGGETEQTKRAELLEARGWAVVLREAELTPGALAAAIESALLLPDRPPQPPLTGAAAAARCLTHALRVAPRPSRLDR